MASKKLKAIFFAYSANAFDSLIPYAVLCRKKNIPCTIILGDDYLTQKVSIKKIFLKILSDYNISIYCKEIIGSKQKPYVQFFFNILWDLTNKLIQYEFIPRIVKNFFKIFLVKFLNFLDNEALGKNIASKFIDNYNETLVFVDRWKKMRLMHSFLSEVKGKANIISVGHGPPHFTWKKKQLKEYNSDISGDIFLASNSIHFDDEFVGKRIVIGNLRYSKEWCYILNKYSEEKNLNKKLKKNVLVLATQKEHTGDWDRMIKVIGKLKLNDEINLRFIPHIRGMSSAKPPSILKNIWDPTISLFDAVKNSDIVLFWRSSAIFQAVLMNKKVLFLSFVAPKNINFLWEENLSSKSVVNNEDELFEIIENYSKDDLIDNECFKKVIWPNGDPWKNASDFLDSIYKKN